MMKKLLIGMCAVIVSFFATMIASSIIAKYFLPLPILDDVFFRLLPRIDWAANIADVLTIVTYVTLFIFAIKPQNASTGAGILLSFGFMWTIRSILMLITPLGDPSGDTAVYGFIEPYPMYGMFPSGHTATVFLGYYWLREMHAPKWVTKTAIVGIVIEILTLLVTRGHYSIDIVGGAVLAYFAVQVGKRFLMTKV